MPTLEDIEKIKTQILEIAHEPSILAERGETPVDIEPPDSGIPDDLNDLLGEALDDFQMDDLEALEAGLGMEESQEKEDKTPEVESFDLPEMEDVGSEEFGLPEMEDFESEDLDLPEMEETEGEDFDLPDMEEPENLDFDIPDEEAEGVSVEKDVPSFEDFSEVEEPEEESEEEPESSGPEGEIEELDDFALPEMEETESEDFDLPDMETESMEFDLSMDNEEFGIDLSSEESAGEVSLGDEDDLNLEEFEVVDDDLDEESFEVDEFNLGDLGQDFGVLDDSEDLSFSPPEQSPFDSGEIETGVEEELEDEEFQLSDEDFRKLTATLKTLPRNLKLVIEEYIGEKNLSGEKLKKLTDALIAGKSPKEIASITSKVTGQRIKIPSGYEKRSGINFEEEKNTFSYRFKHIILPLIRRIAIGAAVIAVLTFSGYKFVYTPLYSLYLYNKGYKELEADNFDRANEYFDRASQKEIFKKQFYRYADGYRDKKQWEYAEEKYQKLLTLYPYDKKGTLDYADMEYRYLYRYETASGLLDKFLSQRENVTDYDALILFGDINLDWGLEDPSRFEYARRAYARIMKNYGVENKILMRMMRYFIRTGNSKEIEILKKRFQADKELVVDPYVYAELAEYQINRNDLSDVKDILFRAKDADSTLPEIHYQLARYFRRIKDGIEEDKAIAQTLHYLEEKEPLSMKQREIKIDTYRRAGERSYAKNEYLQAQEYYEKGISLLAESRELSVVSIRNPRYGKLYADLGDIYYFQGGDMDRALEMYNKAEEEEYHSEEVHYKKGYIYYRFKEYRKALLDFYSAAGDFSTNTNLLFSTANTLYRNNDLFMAEGYYNHLLDILENRLYAETPLQLSFRDDHRKLLKDLIMATNNMGVVQYGLYERTGNPEKFTRAMVAFTESGDYFDTLTRDPETMQRSKMRNLSFINQKTLLYPIKGYTLEIYGDIEKDMHYMNFD